MTKEYGVEKQSKMAKSVWKKKHTGRHMAKTLSSKALKYYVTSEILVYFTNRNKNWVNRGGGMFTNMFSPLLKHCNLIIIF